MFFLQLRTARMVFFCVCLKVPGVKIFIFLVFLSYFSKYACVVFRGAVLSNVTVNLFDFSDDFI